MEERSEPGQTVAPSQRLGQIFPTFWLALAAGVGWPRLVPKSIGDPADHLSDHSRRPRSAFMPRRRGAHRPI